MFRLINEGCLKGFGIVKFGDREVINITGSFDITQFELGINISFTKVCPLHIGCTIGSFTFYIQFFGIQFFEGKNEQIF